MDSKMENLQGMHGGKLDPITFEILSHRFWQITDEMAITLERVTGSPVTSEAGDYMVTIFRANGDPVIGGCAVLYHAGITGIMCKNIIERYREDPGIHEDDIFIFNDPYLGAMHTPDAAVIAPIHYEGKLIGWTGTMTHLLDVGGIDPGGICPRATEVFHEGFRFPGLKIVEKGKTRKDVFDSILNMVREPGMVALDIKAEIAASQVAKFRMHEIIETYGIDTIKTAMDDMISYSESRMRARLMEFPDGVFRTVEYLDHDGLEDKIYKVVLEMRKEKDFLIFNFSGTSLQAPGFVNCTSHGTLGAVFAAVAPLLGYDIPWNQGIINTINLLIPEGTLLNPKFPAPVSMASIAAAHVALNASMVTICKMLNTSEKYKEELTSLWCAGIPALNISGQNKDGNYFISILMDIMAGGGGARSFMDGVDTGGIIPMCAKSICPNVERMEQMYPLLYLFRRQKIDSGGPGKFRGGVGGELALVLYDSPTGEATGTFFGMGFDPALSTALSGGMPANCNSWAIFRQAHILEKLREGKWIEEIWDLGSSPEIIPPKGVTTIKKGDLFYMHWMGGGGYGDPIERQPQSVMTDVHRNLVSVHCAEDIYGVVIDPRTLKLDLEKTEEKREYIRELRKAFPSPSPLPLGERVRVRGIPGERVEKIDSRSIRLNEYLRQIKTPQMEGVGCGKCGYIFCYILENFKDHCLFMETSLKKSGPSTSDKQRFILRQFFCPGCLTLIETEMTLKGSPFLWDVQITI